MMMSSGLTIYCLDMLSSIKPPKVNYHDNYLVKYPDVDIVTYYRYYHSALFKIENPCTIQFMLSII